MACTSDYNAYLLKIIEQEGVSDMVLKHYKLQYALFPPNLLPIGAQCCNKNWIQCTNYHLNRSVLSSFAHTLILRYHDTLF